MRTHHRYLLAADGSRVAWGEAGPRGEAGRSAAIGEAEGHPEAARAEPPALLLCNGLTTNTVFWRHLLPHLEVHHRVLTWDLKGHGDSGPARTRGGASV